MKETELILKVCKIEKSLIRIEKSLKKIEEAETYNFEKKKEERIKELELELRGCGIKYR